MNIYMNHIQISIHFFLTQRQKVLIFFLLFCDDPLASNFKIFSNYFFKYLNWQPKSMDPPKWVCLANLDLLNHYPFLASCFSLNPILAWGRKKRRYCPSRLPTIVCSWRSSTRGYMKSLGWVHTFRTGAISKPVVDLQLIFERLIMLVISILVIL